MVRKIYKSQKRYMDENPAITFRMKKEEKERIDAMSESSGRSISDLVRTSLLGLEQDFSEEYEKIRIDGYNHGYRNAKRKYRTWHFCNVCNNAIDILPNSDAHKAIIQFMKEGSWGHPQCHNPQVNNPLVIIQM